MQMQSTDPLKEYIETIIDLLYNSSVMQMNDYIQHSDVTTFRHCLHVSLMSYLICLKLSFIHFDLRAVARGALLHDMFLYNWHNKSVARLHGFFHPAIALHNAEENVTDLGSCEKDIILNHMWPLTIYRRPKYKETFVVMAADKICTILEVLRIRHIGFLISIDNFVNKFIVKNTRIKR